MAIKKCVKFLSFFFHFTKVLTKPTLKGLDSLSNILHSITDTALGIALKTIRIHSASFECIKRFSLLPDNR